MLLRLMPTKTTIPFLKGRWVAMVFSIALLAASAGAFITNGLNFGIDFKGGVLIEIGIEQPTPLDPLRTGLADLGLGDVGVQEFGDPKDLLVRLEQQPGTGDEQNAALQQVRDRLGELIEGEISYRRIETVGPKISGELIRSGILAIGLAIGAILIYISLRFEWQFGVGAVIALLHDVLATVGFFAVTQLEFNLSIIAAILTIVGYSLNDTVVVYDRVRENLRKFRSLALVALLDQTMNETLTRTIMTSVTTLIALFALYFLGGEVVRGFVAAMIWGVFIGTYSSVFIAAPLLVWLKVDRQSFIPADGQAARP